MKVNLGRFEKTDAPAIRKAMETGKIQPFLSRAPYPYPKDAEFEFISKAHSDHQGRAFAIVNEFGDFDGVISEIDSRYPNVAKNEIGYWLSAEYWGQGIGTQAVALMLDDLKQRGIRRLVAGAMAHNIASQRVLTNNGFLKCGDVEIVSVAHKKPVAAHLFLWDGAEY